MTVLSALKKVAPFILLARSSQAVRVNKFEDDMEVLDISYSPKMLGQYTVDAHKLYGSGAYADVYGVQEVSSKVVKLIKPDKSAAEVEAECNFAQGVIKVLPHNSVGCDGTGTTTFEGKQRGFAIFDKVGGESLMKYSKAGKVGSLGEVVKVLHDLAEAMQTMDAGDGTNSFAHLDLNPGNVIISDEMKLIDYGISSMVSSSDGAARQSNLRQMYRWLGWEFLWLLSSHADDAGQPQWNMNNDNPWEQLPDGFKPLFKITAMRPPPYATDKLSADLIREHMGGGFYDSLMRANFKGQAWTNAANARAKIAELMGFLFMEVAKASDNQVIASDFKKVLGLLEELRKLVKSS